MKDIGYNAQYDLIDSVTGGEELRMCLLVKTSLGRIRRWRQDQCQSIGPFSAANRSGMAPVLVLLSSIFVLNFVENCISIVFAIAEIKCTTVI